jgi:threonine/homoserine/homoserine lactone efflux protein
MRISTDQFQRSTKDSTMPESSVLIQFVLGTLLLLLTPGPCLALLVSTGVSQGKSAAMYVVGGIALSDVLGSLLTALGLVVWLIQVPTALLALKLFGIAYLLFATYTEWRSVSVNAVQTRDPVASSQTPWKGFWRGFWINILNPAWLFLIGFFPQFLRPELGSVQLQVLVLSVLFCLLSTVFGAVLVYLSSGLGRFLVTASGSVRGRYFLVGVYGFLAVYFVMKL